MDGFVSTCFAHASYRSGRPPNQIPFSDFADAVVNTRSSVLHGVPDPWRTHASARLPTLADPVARVSNSPLPTPWTTPLPRFTGMYSATESEAPSTVWPAEAPDPDTVCPRPPVAPPTVPETSPLPKAPVASPTVFPTPDVALLAVFPTLDVVSNRRSERAVTDAAVRDFLTAKLLPGLASDNFSYVATRRRHSSVNTLSEVVHRIVDARACPRNRLSSA